ncbi:MAG: LacI family DNA-binding transcriptional regulator [Angelakisella sp.]|nr:LacI family DNA-binding transcriptional regulator [Angelakisella sp.]
MKKTKVTIKDIAKAAGVSAATVSMVLNGSNKFPEQTCRKVIDACNELGYVRGKLRQAESMEDKVLVVVVPTLSNLYFVKAVGAMQRRAKDLGYSLLVFETLRERTQEARIIHICTSFPFAGVIFYYPPENSMHMAQLEAAKPVIHIYDKDVYDNENNLAIDGLRVGSVIGKHLLSLGHEKIVYLCLDFETKQVMRVRRLEGLRSVYRAAGYDPEKSVMVCTPQLLLPKSRTSPDGYELGYLLTKQLIERNVDFTAAVGLNDMIAIGAMDAIIDAGKKVPEDYSVCGCDNTSASHYRGISLTTVDSYPIQSGQEAIEFLVRKLEHTNFFDDMEENPEGTTQIEYYPKLIIRKTSGPRKGKAGLK